MFFSAAQLANWLNKSATSPPLTPRAAIQTQTRYPKMKLNRHHIPLLLT